MSFSLPDELLDKIYQYYWSFQYKNVCEEINEPLILENKINGFLNKYKNTICKDNITFYYKQFNRMIEKLLLSKGKRIICKHNKLKLSLCLNNSDCWKDVNINYKLFTFDFTTTFIINISS